MRAWVIALLLAGLALAGCTEPSESTEPTGSDEGAMVDSETEFECPSTDDAESASDADEATEEPAENGTGNATDGNETDEAAPQDPGVRVDENGCEYANTVPVASLSASQAEGEFPYDVTFEFDAVDEDGDALAWTLLVDGHDGCASEGTNATLPGNFTCTIDSEGTFEAVFAANDGDIDGIATIQLTATAPVAEEPTEEPGEEEPVDDGDPWVDTDADGYCHAVDGVTSIGGAFYIHERDDGGDDGTPGTGYIAGGGIWLYEETNGVPGLQVGGEGPTGADGAYVDCYDPDLVLF